MSCQDIRLLSTIHNVMENFIHNTLSKEMTLCTERREEKRLIDINGN